MPNGQEYSLEEALSVRREVLSYGDTTQQSADETVRKAAKVANKVLNIAGTINLLQELQAVDRAVPISSVLDSAQLLSLRKRVNAKGHQVASAGAGQMAYTLHFMVDADEKPAALFKTMDSEEMREVCGRGHPHKCRLTRHTDHGRHRNHFRPMPGLPKRPAAVSSTERGDT